MEEIIELLSQIQELAGVGIEVLSGGGGEMAPEGELPPEEAMMMEGEEGLPPEEEVF